MECHECKQPLKPENFTVRLKGFPTRLKQLEGRFVLVEFTCPNCGRDGVSYTGLNGFVPRKHFAPKEAA